jgi:hypothetical protein
MLNVKQHEKYKKFLCLYRAEFGRLDVKSNEDYKVWSRFVNKIPDDKMEKLIETVSENWSQKHSGFQPFIGEFRKYLKIITKESKPKRYPQWVIDGSIKLGISPEDMPTSVYELTEEQKEKLDIVTSFNIRPIGVKGME